MRKILIALPCLLLSGVAAANGAATLDARHGADGVLLHSALEATQARPASLIQSAGPMEAATKKKPTKVAPKTTATPAPAAAPTDNAKRFNMTQDGKRMTADDFDAWMKKNGYRVAGGAGAKPKEESPKADDGKK